MVLEFLFLYEFVYCNGPTYVRKAGEGVPVPCRAPYLRPCWGRRVTILVCELCLQGKMTKRPFTAKGNYATKQLELVHIDVCGLMSIQARDGYEYFITFTDDYSGYGYVYLMRYKSETFEKF